MRTLRAQAEKRALLFPVKTMRVCLAIIWQVESPVRLMARQRSLTRQPGKMTLRSKTAPIPDWSSVRKIRQRLSLEIILAELPVMLIRHWSTTLPVRPVELPGLHIIRIRRTYWKDSTLVELSDMAITAWWQTVEPKATVISLAPNTSEELPVDWAEI